MCTFVVIGRIVGEEKDDTSLVHIDDKTWWDILPIVEIDNSKKSAFTQIGSIFRNVSGCACAFAFCPNS